MFTSVPLEWNISLAEAWVDDPEVKFNPELNTFEHKISQEDIYKNVTILIKSPSEYNASYNDMVEFVVRVWSETRPEIEKYQPIKVTIRKPDLVLKNINVLNTDLIESTNITIRAKTENKYCYAEQVNFSLYINNVLIENKTLDKLEEDIEEIIEFYWDPTDSNFTVSKGQSVWFKVVINGDSSIEETDYENNAGSIRKFIGQKSEEEEFNWRPIYALLTLLIIFIAIYAVYRWRKKI